MSARKSLISALKIVVQANVAEVPIKICLGLCCAPIIHIQGASTSHKSFFRFGRRTSVLRIVHRGRFLAQTAQSAHASPPTHEHFGQKNLSRSGNPESLICRLVAERFARKSGWRRPTVRERGRPETEQIRVAARGRLGEFGGCLRPERPKIPELIRRQKHFTALRETPMRISQIAPLVDELGKDGLGKKLNQQADALREPFS